MPDRNNLKEERFTSAHSFDPVMSILKFLTSLLSSHSGNVWQGQTGLIAADEEAENTTGLLSKNLPQRPTVQLVLLVLQGPQQSCPKKAPPAETLFISK